MNLAPIYAPPSIIAQDQYADGFNLTVSNQLLTFDTVTAGVITSDMRVGRHFYFPKGTYSAPSASVGVAAGIGASVTQTPLQPVDSLIPLTLTTGLSPSTGTLLNVSYGQQFPTTSLGLSFSYTATNVQALQLYFTNITTAGYSVACVTAPTPSANYAFSVQTVGLF